MINVRELTQAVSAKTGAAVACDYRDGTGKTVLIVNGKAVELNLSDDDADPVETVCATLGLKDAPPPPAPEKLTTAKKAKKLFGKKPK